jgi:hypothetical protein
MVPAEEEVHRSCGTRHICHRLAGAHLGPKLRKTLAVFVLGASKGEFATPLDDFSREPALILSPQMECRSASSAISTTNLECIGSLRGGM